jgi:hypothetical protein
LCSFWWTTSAGGAFGVYGGKIPNASAAEPALLAAELVQRILILVVPVAGIIYPLWSLIPRIYQGHMQRRVYRMYGELKLLELELRNAAPETRECAISRPRSARAMTRFIDRFQ